MTARADLKEYLELFENIVERKEMPAEDWAPTIIPLLNDRFRGTAVKLPPEIKANYQDLKKVLLERDEQHIQNLAATFWTTPKERGVTALDFGQQLLRLLDRFILGEDRAACLDSMAKERLIHELIKEGRAYVCQRKPKSLLEATRLAEEYFQFHEQSYTNRCSRTGGSAPEQQQPNR